MAMRYFARERIFTGCGPNLVNSAAVFATDDLTQCECETLAESVQRYFDELHQYEGGGPWFFGLGPSPEEDAAAFIILKSEWDGQRHEIEGYRESAGDSWQSDIYWFYTVALEHANIIRQLRQSELPTVYLQCDSGQGFETFDCVDSLTRDEIAILESVLGEELYQTGSFLRIISDYHAEREPSVYVQARLGWKRFEEDLKHDAADEGRLEASQVAYQCIEEIKALRSKPQSTETYDALVGDEDGDESEDANLLAPTPEQTKAHESLRSTYRDPDNYWRNVWLYELRKAGKTNSAIRDELANRAQDFAPLESDNALRSAIESIAHFHHWPLIKGRSGRPRGNNSLAE